MDLGNFGCRLTAVLPRRQPRSVGLGDVLGQELASDRPIERALPVLGEGGGVPRRGI